jgi:hypothetical protein
LSFPKIQSGGIRAVRQNQRIIQCDDLLACRIKRCRAVLFEIAESEHTCAKLRNRTYLSQNNTTHFLRSLFFAGRLHLPPIVLSAPLAIRPMATCSSKRTDNLTSSGLR